MIDRTIDRAEAVSRARAVVERMARKIISSIAALNGDAVVVHEESRILMEKIKDQLIGASVEATTAAMVGLAAFIEEDA